MLAIKVGISPKNCFFWCWKTESELLYAINKKFYLLIQSESEINIIEKLRKKNSTVDIGIRLNPNTDAKTLKQISTGKDNKFGVDEKTFIKLVLDWKNLNFESKCLSVHIGSQITNHKPYEKMLAAVDKIIDKLKFKFEYVDLGVSMGISYGKKQNKLNYKNIVTP